MENSKLHLKNIVGDIPNNWKLSKISEVSIKITDGEHTTPVRSESGYYLLSARNILNNKISLNNVDFVEQKEYDRIRKRCNPEKGDILITCSGTIGRVTVVPPNLKFVLVRSVALIKPNNDQISSTFLKCILQSFFLQKQILRSLNQGAQANLFLNHIQSLKIPLPPLPEQKKIAKILSTWDEAIEQNQKLIEQLKLRKKGLMQQLLTGKKRLASFDGEWEERKIGDYLNESKVLSSQNDPQKRLSVKLTLKGVEKRPVRGTESKDSTTFYVRKAGQFIYGKQNLHKGAMGIIPEELDGFESTQDLPTFDIKPDLNSKWFFYYMSRSNFYEKLENIATGTGSKRIHPKSLFKVKIFVPSFREQNAIVNILSTNDSEIELQEQKLESLQQQKKGLMQKLLTGQIRVSTND